MSEDAGYRIILGEIGAKCSGWLQIVFSRALAEGHIDKVHHADLISRLAQMRHGHVSVNAETLIAIAENYLDRFEVVSNYVGTQNAEIKSHIIVVANYADMALFRRQKHHRRTLSILIDHLIRPVPEAFSKYLAAIAVAATNRSVTYSYSKFWCANHHHKFRSVRKFFMRIIDGNSSRSNRPGH